VQFRSSKDPVLFLNDPAGMTRSDRRAMLDDLGQLNQIRHNQLADPEILARISQYELAFRMQASAPELADLSDEPDWVFDLYGPDSRRPGTYAYNCLLARRMAERGVRFTQLFHRGWDQHDNLQTHLANQCRDTDQASAALITDLKQRGMLEDTLVIWGGEFGRTVYSQGKIGEGRDHHGRCFSVWVAGGGVKGGASYGLTDDYSYNIVENPVHIRDLNATILHCLGMDHNRFTFRSQGLNQKPTGVEPAHVVKGILA
jgi:arylsulfatase A-like enzyme